MGGKNNGLRIFLLSVPITLSKKESQEFVSWLKETGHYENLVDLFLSDGERARTMLSGLLLTWLAARKKGAR